jgi:dual specificity tyrosine-phosphorylation-regulated kinase 2/3/4
VARCYDHERKTEIAVKITTHLEGAAERNSREKDILRKLKGKSCSSITKADLAFTFRNHFCVTFGILGKDGGTILKLNGSKDLSPRVVRCIAQDLVEAINVYHSCGVVHCCLTRANVIHIPNTNAQFQLIDFSHAWIGEFIPHQFPVDIPPEYYPPELVLGLPTGIHLDMWCLGCLIVELICGRNLFDGKDKPNKLMSYATVLGVPSPEFIATWPGVSDVIDPETGWLFKEDLVDEKPERSVNLRLLLGATDVQLCDLVSRLLTWEAEKRMTPEEALNHPWITNREARVPAPV